ncbi:MAG: hypothetical protein K1X89_01695 [Myxococcaceae bacterium]|nr:hypothetical protein [Myxococcaceae bacterium]
MNSLKRVAVTVVSCGLLACGSTTSQPDASVFVDDIKPVTDIYGYSWDPEVFLANLFQCGPMCMFPPTSDPYSPLFDSTRLSGTKVTMMTLGTSWEPTTFSSTSDEMGTWSVRQVPQHAGAPYYFPKGEGGAFALPPDMAPYDRGPDAGYLPTLQLRPVASNYAGTCAAVESAQLSNIGILEAVAKFISVDGGTAVTPEDLVNPAKFGGVAVIWLTVPGDPVEHRVGFGVDHTTLQASLGKVINISIAPPGMAPPELQSTRGFVVDPSLPGVSDLGISVVVLAPEEAGKEVTIAAVDTAHDPMQGRPLYFPEFTIPIPSGVITYGSFPMLGGPPGPNDSPRPLPQPVATPEEVVCWPSERQDKFREGIPYQDLEKYSSAPRLR